MKKKDNKLTKMLIVIGILLFVIAGALMYAFSTSERASDKYVVMLDAQADSNTTKVGLVSEEDVNEQVLQAVKKQLDKDTFLQVMTTKEEGEKASVAMRLARIQEASSAFVVSFRCTSQSQGDSAMRIYACPPTSKYHEESLSLAEEIQQAYETYDMQVPINYYYYKEIREDVYQEHIVDSDDMTDYGEETFTLMENSNCPVVIVTMLDVDDEQQVANLANEEGIEQLATIYTRAIQKQIEGTDGNTN